MVSSVFSFSDCHFYLVMERSSSLSLSESIIFLFASIVCYCSFIFCAASWYNVSTLCSLAVL